MMNHRRVLFSLAMTLTVVGATLLQAAMAGTIFNCNIDAVDSSGKAVPVSSVNCSAIVAYVNPDTEESQSRLRSCKITGKTPGCTQTFDDSEITIPLPITPGIAEISPVETAASSLRTRGCLRTNVIRETSTDLMNNTVTLTYEISCP